MNKDLLVEIFVPLTEPASQGKIGTGYPVAENRILTARHVIRPDKRDFTKPIEIRWHHQPVATRRWIALAEQDILWVGDENCDAAVLNCLFPVDAKPWGMLALESPRPEAWESEGFPDVGKQDDETRVATAMRGNMHRMARTSWFFALDLFVGAASDALHQGASGSPVMSNGKLCGVIVQCPPGFKAERLWAVPICRLLEMPGFCEAIRRTPQRALHDLLEERLVLTLSASEEARETLEGLTPAIEDKLATRNAEPWAKRLIERLLGLQLEHLIPTLRSAQRDLLVKQKYAAARVIVTLSNMILPLVFKRADVRVLHSQMFDVNLVLVNVPVANPTVADILMAKADGRPICFCKADGDRKALMATYRFKKEPPTSGIDDEMETWTQNVESDLMSKFVDPDDDPFLNDEQRRQMVANQLGTESEEQRTRYMVFRFKTDDDRRKAANALMRIKQRYPMLVLLDLSTQGSQIVEENDLFQRFEHMLEDALKESET